ncbi:DeoR/GlpR family DNA-binding transcription regulator [Pontibacter sp. G13]|uniref:DeoR/GlpR family DNA-binding transcription regulator n=1 Tax=Pontibacter sp. G13 TaxID=3074898 RepID=UPI00288B64F2|nr:DeoR/GlpR family DNA-binding transcription regulator [Pontibacter sp. G13]WNJ18128.1 DeoR/GlpR family DNA-binding transcription regulator [Pontibacter sp. G13]
MLKDERHSFILDQLRTKNKVLTFELSQSLEVSEDTIRRDLKELAEMGRIKKVHGGAVSHSLNPYHYKDREIYAHNEKIELAEKARGLIRNHQVVIMDGGTTNVELAKRLPMDLKATIFTNSLPVAVQLAGHPLIETIFLGGKVLKNAQVTIGSEVIDVLGGIKADICFLGTRSLQDKLGITEIDWEETKVKRAILAASNEVVSMVIQEKIGTVQPYIICEPQRITTLVTTLEKRDPFLSPFFEMGIEIL